MRHGKLRVRQRTVGLHPQAGIPGEMLPVIEADIVLLPEATVANSAVVVQPLMGKGGDLSQDAGAIGTGLVGVYQDFGTFQQPDFLSWDLQRGRPRVAYYP